MYLPDPFVEEDAERLGALIRAYPLATLVLNGPDGLVAAHVPLVSQTSEKGRMVLIGHVARANPFWTAAVDADAVMAIFCGPDGYVSPALYASKQAHGRVVPTWNYARIEVRGRIVVEADPTKVRPYVEALTEVMEAPRNAPWSVDDAPTAYIDALSRGIVGFRIEVEDVRGGFKLSQNKTEADYVGVRDGLAGSDRTGERDVGLMMTQASNLPAE